MKKLNINGVISYNQYKLVDIMLFMVIMTALEAVNVFALRKWFADEVMMFSISLMFTVSLIVLVRWNFFAALFTVSHGLIYCGLISIYETVVFDTYVIYAVGNSFLLLSWFLFKLIPKQKLFSKWYLTLIYPAVAFVLVALGRTVVAVCFGYGFVDSLKGYVMPESLNIAFAAIALLILRRFDGMLEDQKAYLKRVAREKDEAQTPKDEVWAGYTELDENELKKLHDYSSGESEGDGIDLRDEYPPDSR